MQDVLGLSTGGVKVEPEQMVVAVAHDTLLVDHDHRAPGAEALREGAVVAARGLTQQESGAR
jgi:hypothetical protein